MALRAPEPGSETRGQHAAQLLLSGDAAGYRAFAKSADWDRVGMRDGPNRMELAAFASVLGKATGAPCIQAFHEGPGSVGVQAMLLAHILQLERAVEAGTEGAAARYSRNVDETAALLDRAHSTLQMNDAFLEMRNTTQPVLDKLTAIEKRLTALEKKPTPECCVVQEEG
jgi:hypothetical protein